MQSRFVHADDDDLEEGEEEQVTADGAKGGDGKGGGLLKSISSCFDSYMGIYVALEDKALDEGMAKILSAETWQVNPSGRADTRVFNSSKELFLALKRQYKRSTALNMSGVTHELLHKVWSKHLRGYAKRVLEQLPPVTQPADPSQPPTCSIDEPAQRVVCAVVNTSEYCSDTTEGLAETVGKTIDEEFRDKVDLGAVQDAFNGVVDSGMKVLVAALEARVGPHVKAMVGIKWDAMEEIGDDTSQYMQDIVTQTRQMMPQLGEHLSGKYVTFFCTKFVSNFVPRLIGNIYRCKRIGEVGAQQMQVDVGTLKQTLLDLPMLGQASATTSYNRLVAHELGKAEQVLKLIQTPEELLETTVEEMRSTCAGRLTAAPHLSSFSSPQLPSKSTLARMLCALVSVAWPSPHSLWLPCRSGVEPDLQKILELKGLKKAGTEKLLEAYNNKLLEAREGGEKIFTKMLGRG